MNVIYDISVLAHAQRDPKARTGVFRVVDNIARGLADSDQVSLRFCTAEGVNEPVDFLAGDAQLSRCRPCPLHVSPLQAAPLPSDRS